MRGYGSSMTRVSECPLLLPQGRWAGILRRKGSSAGGKTVTTKEEASRRDAEPLTLPKRQVSTKTQRDPGPG